MHSDDSSNQKLTQLPSSQVVAPVSWQIEAQIQEALQNQPDPGGGPPNCQFIPYSVQSQVLYWIQASKFSCHPEIDPAWIQTPRTIFEPVPSAPMENILIHLPLDCSNLFQYLPTYLLPKRQWVWLPTMCSICMEFQLKLSQIVDPNLPLMSG